MKEIPLSQGKVALVDDEDFEYLNQWKWHCTSSKHSYAKRSDYKLNKDFYMHREILKCSGVNINVDHVDRNTLNNQKENLRFCDQSQNNGNQLRDSKNKTSQYKGVCYSPRKGYKKFWLVQIQRKGLPTITKRLSTEKEAAKMYNQLAIKYFGEFANLNKIEE